LKKFKSILLLDTQFGCGCELPKHGCFGRAHRAYFVPYKIRHLLHPWRSDVLAATHRSIYTSPAGGD